MIDPTPFVKHLGPRVAHVTAASNVSGILSHGLRRAHDLAMNANVQDIALRSERIRLVSDTTDATLNHQRPILHGIAAASRIIDGHTPESWAKQLDRRVFFWPERLGKDFASSIARDVPIAVLWLDTERLLSRFHDHIHLSPINSGSFIQGGAYARRGDWIYVPAMDGLDAFRVNRVERGLKRTRDAVKEVSMTRGIDAADLTELLISVENPQVPASGS